MTKKMRVQGNKIICDAVHGQITLHPLCIAIIDTVQFQRLRSIKQLGMAEYVYPSAVHNRFSHSIGVSFLAGEFLRHLKLNQPELNITKEQVLCLEIAGLCHDLGHGPFSHTWENFMNHPSNPNKKCWKHELASVNIFEQLIESNDLKMEFTKYSLKEVHIEFIKELILGKNNKNTDETFLYQIVNNEDSGLDVDKWDYYLRDSHHSGLQYKFEYKRLLSFAKVIRINNEMKICFRDKDLAYVSEMFRTRSDLHRHLYKHRVLSVMEDLLCEALIKSDNKIIGLDGEPMNFSEWSMLVQDSSKKNQYSKFYNLTDSIIWNSLNNSQDPKIISLMKAILTRTKHKVIHVLDTKSVSVKCTNVREEFSSFIQAKQDNFDQSLITLKIAQINWGKGSLNPMEKVYFYSKQNPNFAQNYLSMESMIGFPLSFEETKIFLICKNTEDEISEKILTFWKQFWLKKLNQN